MSSRTAKRDKVNAQNFKRSIMITIKHLPLIITGCWFVLQKIISLFRLAENTNNLSILCFLRLIVTYLGFFFIIRVLRSCKNASKILKNHSGYLLNSNDDLIMKFSSYLSIFVQYLLYLILHNGYCLVQIQRSNEPLFNFIKSFHEYPLFCFLSFDYKNSMINS